MGQCLETFLLVPTWGQACCGIQWVEVRDVAEHPTIHRTALHSRIIQFQLSVVLRLGNSA